MALSVPVVLFSHMVAELFGYTLPPSEVSRGSYRFWGTLIFVSGGMPFLTGAADRYRVSVAFIASVWCRLTGVSRPGIQAPAFDAGRCRARGTCRRHALALRGFIVDVWGMRLLSMSCGCAVRLAAVTRIAASF